MHGKLTARRYARLLEHHTGSAMADHDLIPTGELPDHFHQIEIVRLAGMPGEHGHGIAAAEHERIVIVRMSLQSCHRIVCREPYAGVGSDLPTVRHGIYPIRDSVLVKRFQILEKAHSVHRIDGQDSYFLRHNHNFLNETIVLISKSVIFVYGKCRLPPVQIQERTSE